MARKRSRRTACWLASASMGVAVSTSGVTAQVASQAPRMLDLWEVAGLALAYEVPAWREEGPPKPSKALIDLVQTRPDSLMTWDGGASWWLRERGGGKVLPVRQERYPLQPTDIKAVDRVLQKPYIEAWVTCMRAAWAGKGSSKCAMDLAELAQSQPDAKAKKVLLADLAGRVLALAPQNPDWHALAYGKKRSPLIREAFLALRKLEAVKMAAAYAWKTQPGSVPEGIAFTNAGTVAATGPGIAWEDFAAVGASEGGWLPDPRGSRGNRAYWGIRDGKAYQIRNPKEFGQAEICALIMSPDKHLLITDPKRIEEIASAPTLKAALQKAKANNIRAYLSRRGSAVLGEFPQ